MHIENCTDDREYVMAMDVTTKGIFIDFDLGDVKRSAEATEKMKNPTNDENNEEGKKGARGSARPSFFQSYTGKGGLLDIIA